MKFSVTRVSRAFLVACLCFTVTVAFAQFRAGIQGTVTDSSGAVVKDAKVSVTNQDNGKVIDTTTNDNGFHTATGLPPGTHTIAVTRPGFKNAVTKDLVVAPDPIKGLNVTLPSGGATEQV